MNYSDRKFAAYITAVDPFCACQLMFSDKTTEILAVEDVLRQFDKYFPDAVDREVSKIMTYAEYMKQVEAAENFNYYMNS